MPSELNAALQRLRNALIEAEKRRNAQWIGGFLTGALLGGIAGLGGMPNHSWSYLESRSSSQLDTWADDVEDVAENATWPSED